MMSRSLSILTVYVYLSDNRIIFYLMMIRLSDMYTYTVKMLEISTS